jgi:hypothetical protein
LQVSNTDLSFSEGKLRTELCPLSDAEILLLAELAFQCQQLLCGEGGAGFAVGLVLAELQTLGRRQTET